MPVSGLSESEPSTGEHGALLMLADSQLLFRPDVMPWVAEHFAGRYPRAAYIGAANANRPAYFELACAGLESLVGQSVPTVFIREERDIPAYPADILVLAGGSVTAGWQFLRQESVRAWLDSVWRQPGSLAIGVSAGAIHLARGCDPEVPEPQAQPYLGWLPHFLAVHEEQQQWPSRLHWQNGGRDGDFIGVHMGAGLWFDRHGRRWVGRIGERESGHDGNDG